jgi:hypothetical protein
MQAYLNAVISGEAEPFWPHSILLLVSILSAFTVGFGIILESPKYSTAAHRIATWLVLGGIAVESLCTVFLFAFDESISSKQQSTIESQQSTITTQNTRIISLQKRLAARTLSDEQVEAIGARLKNFSPQTLQIIPYWQNRESKEIADRIATALGRVGWTLQNPKRYTTLVAVITGVFIHVDPRASEKARNAAKELTSALNDNDIEAAEEDIADTTTALTSERINMQVGIKP